MGQWRARVRKRKRSAVDILRKIMRDGNRLYIGSACGEPQHLVRSLIKLLPRHRDIEIVQNLSMGSLPGRLETPGGKCAAQDLLCRSQGQGCGKRGPGRLHPDLLFFPPRLFKEEPLWKFDIALVQVSPPDEHGYCSMGISVGMDKCAVECAN